MFRSHFLLLWLWIIVGTCLRFIHLAALPPWTDESATMVFSLGNSFYDVPLNKFIDLPTLIEPLRLNDNAGINDVTELLLTESTHPPLFFILTHLWLMLFPGVDGLVSLWAARSLSALLGVAAIPAIFSFAKLAFASQTVAQIAAALMAVSPFGIFIAVQARHYTAVVLLVIASVSCFMVVFRSLARGGTIPLWLGLTWISVNCLGVATHYFFILTLAAIAIAFVPLLWQYRQNPKILLRPQWRRLYVIAFGSFIGCLVWLPSLLAVSDSSPTDWIYQSNALEKWLEPLGRFVLWLMSSVVLLPSSLYDFSLGIVIVSGLLTLLFWFVYLPLIIEGLKLQQHPAGREAVTALGTYLIAAIALFFLFTYLGLDLTLAGRFQFVYFPLVIVLTAAGLSHLWSGRNSPSLAIGLSKYRNGKKTLAIFLTISLISGLVANLNSGYLQNHRPDLAIEKIIQGSTAPIAIAINYRHHGDTGRAIGLAWGLKDLPQINSPLFYLAERNGDRNLDSATILSRELTRIKRPLDLWLLNFRDEVKLSQDCILDSDYRGTAGQYKYRLYHCRD